MRRWLQLVLATLREIGDESAYQRYLTRHQIAASGKAWRKFSEERLRARYSRAKCC